MAGRSSAPRAGLRQLPWHERRQIAGHARAGPGPRARSPAAGWFHQLLVNPAAHQSRHAHARSSGPRARSPFPSWAAGRWTARSTPSGDIFRSAIDDAADRACSPPAIELIPADAPIVHRTMMAGAGNRSMLAGFPESVHVAFDADVVRMAKAWKGRFFDAKGMWENRGGQHLAPLGGRRDRPAARAGIALLDTASGSVARRQIQGRSKHRREVQRICAGQGGRPTSTTSWKTIDIHEQPLPVLPSGGPELVRAFRMVSSQPVTRLYFLAAQGSKIEAKSPNEWSCRWKADGQAARGQAAGGQARRPGRAQRRRSETTARPRDVAKRVGVLRVEMSW